MPPIRTLRPPTYAPPIALDSSAVPDDDKPVWIQVARAGEFRGHATPFRFTQAVFDELIRNFRRHPSFRAGPDGVGCADVIAFDFHHASEKPAAELARFGAPAQAWAQDLAARVAATDLVKNEPELQLMALTRYLPLARQYVRDGSYKWTSVAVWPDTSDPVTNERLGWYLSSIAFTNDPFIQGMVPIAASAREGAARLLGGGHFLDPYNPAKTIEDVICSLREILGIDRMADLPAIFGELAKLRAFALAPETAPPGVEVAEMVGSLRILLNLPTLSDAATVFAELDKLLAAISSGPSAALSRKETTAMSVIRSFLLGRLSLDTASTEEVVVNKLKIELESGADAKSKLGALLGALGMENPDEAVNRVAQLMKSAADLERLMPELASLKESAEKAEAETAEQDVSEVMATRGFPESTKPALLHFRRSSPEKWSKEYPRLTEAERKLLAPIATTAGRESTPITTARTEDAPPGTRTAGSATLAEIRAFAGETDVEKAMNLVRKRAKENDEEITFDEVHSRAVALTRAAKAGASAARL